MSNKVWTPPGHRPPRQPELLSAQAKVEMLDMLIQESGNYRHIQAMLSMAAQERDPVLLGTYKSEDGVQLGVFAVAKELTEEEISNEAPGTH